MTVTMYNVSDSIFDAIKRFVSQWNDVEIETFSDDLPEETILAIKECNDIENHPEKYPAYSSWAEAKKAILDEI